MPKGSERVNAQRGGGGGVGGERVNVKGGGCEGVNVWREFASHGAAV